MSEKRYKVPEGMLEAAGKASGWVPWQAVEVIPTILEAAIKWLAEHPTKPSAVEVSGMCGSLHGRGITPQLQVDMDRELIAEWQRRMFLNTEPEIPEEIAKFIWDKVPGAWPSPVGTHVGIHNEQVLAAFHLGQQSKDSK